MKGPADYLIAGFGQALRRPHYILLDLTGKSVAAVGTLLVFGFAVFLFLAEVRVDETVATAYRMGLPPVAAAAFLRSVFDHRALLGQVAIGAGAVSLLAWTALEAFIRGGLVPMTRNSILGDAVAHFPRFLLTGLIRRAVLIGGSGLVGLIALGPLLTVPAGQWSREWAGVEWAVVAGLALIVLLAFCLTILDTVIRCDAADLLGRSLPETLMVAGLPVLIEASLRALGAAACVVSITLGTRPGAVALLGGSLIAGLSVVDSYLLLARYAAVGLMRRDSVTLE